MKKANHTFVTRCFDCNRILAIGRNEEERINKIRKIKNGSCPHCGRFITIKTTPDPQRQCGNCYEFFRPGDRYCRFCGTKKGDGAYAPYPKMLNEPVIYGPMPVTRTHVCKRCGYTWDTCTMIDDMRYCPMCGGEAPYSDFS